MTQSFVTRDTPQPFSRVNGKIPADIQDMALVFRTSLKHIIRAHEPSPQYGLSGSIEILDRLKPEWRQGQEMFDDLRDLATVQRTPLLSWPDLRRDAFLSRLLRSSWTIQTCAALHRGAWSPAVPERGQSGVTAILLQKILGGSIQQYGVEGYGMYFANVLPDKPREEQELDLTRDQFGDAFIQLHPKRQLLTPEELLQGSEYGRAAEVAARYQVLESNFIQATLAMALACASLPHRPSVPPPADLSVSS